MKRKTVWFMMLFLIGFGIGVIVYNHFNPDNVLNTPLPTFEEVSQKVSNRMLAGVDKECNSFKRTADGKWFCPDDGEVYDCSSSPILDDNKCRDAKGLGLLEKENVFMNGDENKIPVLTDVFYGEFENGGGYVDENKKVYKQSWTIKKDKGEIVWEADSSNTPKYHKVNNSIVIRENMASLNDFMSTKTLIADERYGLSYGNINWSYIEVYPYVIDGKELNKELPFKVNGVVVDTFNFKTTNTPLNVPVLINLNDFNTNWTFGDGSITDGIFIQSNTSAWFADAEISSSVSYYDQNRGATTGLGSLEVIRGASYTTISVMRIDLREIAGTGVTWENVSLIVHINEATASPTLDVNVLFENFTENILTAWNTGNCSWLANNDTSSKQWTYGNLNDDSGDMLAEFGSGVLASKVITTTSAHVFTLGLDTTLVQERYDNAENGELRMFLNVTSGEALDYVLLNPRESASAWEIYLKGSVANIPPVCTQSDTNITIEEDSGAWELDANMSEPINISCTDSDGDALTYTCSGTGYTNPNNDDLVFTAPANGTGTYLGNCEVSDGTDSTRVDFQTVVTEINDGPWWDEIVNGSGTRINTDQGYQPVDVNASQYFRDVEDDQTPSNITISVNETDVDCFMNTDANFTIFCNPDSVSVFIITLVGEDSGAATATTSFEEFVAYPPSSPTVILPVEGVYHGNVTLEWTASVSPQGDEIAFYNVTLNDAPVEYTDWYHDILLTNDTSFSWDTREVRDWNDYFLQVVACDNNSLCSVDVSDDAWAVNNTPHWDLIGNDTAQNIYVNLGKQPIINNLSVYFHDYFDDQSPASVVVSDNETGIDCTVETNFSLFCTPTFFEGDYIITVNGTNSVANSSFESFEGYVSNEPPTIPSFISPGQGHLNDTVQLNLSCAGSTDAEGDTVYYDFYGDTNPTPSTQICLNSGGECLWNYTTYNALLYWYCQSNDTWENSTPTTTRMINAQTWDVINLTQTYPSRGEVGQSVLFGMNVTHNEIRYTDVTARLNTSWSPYNYNPTKTAYDNFTEFVTYLDLPSTSGTAYFTWDVNLTYHNGSEFNNDTYGGSFEVYTIFFDYNCTGNATDVVAANFSFWQENTLQEFDFNNETSQVDFDAVFVVYKDNVNVNLTKTYSFDNITDFQLCTPEGIEYKSLAQINYVKDLYDPRQYYFVNQTLNNQTANISLYLLEITLGDGISVNVEDQQGNDVSTAYLYVKRYDPGTDSYHLVSMGLTDDDGEEYLYLRKFDAFYRFEVEKDGVLVYSDTSPRKISDDSIILRLGDISLADLLDSFDKISYSLYNTTNQIILTYSDSGSGASQYCLTVYKTNSSDEGYVCETCSTLTSNTITCDTTGDDGIYIANAWASINPDRPLATLIVDKLVKLITGFGKTGLFGAFLIILSLGCVGVYIGRVYGVVIGTLVGIFISKMLGMLLIGYGTFLGFIILGVIICVYAKD